MVTPCLQHKQQRMKRRCFLVDVFLFNLKFCYHLVYINILYYNFTFAKTGLFSENVHYTKSEKKPGNRKSIKHLKEVGYYNRRRFANTYKKFSF